MFGKLQLISGPILKRKPSWIAPRRNRAAPDRAAERHFRVEVGRCHADAGRGRGQLALGLADVRPARQKRGAVADGERAGKLRRALARGDLRGKVGRRSAGQNRQPEQGALALRLQRRQRRAHLLKLRARLAGIERRSTAAFEQAARQIERLFLDAQGIAGDRQLLAGAAGVGISAGGLRSDADPRDVERGLDRTDVRAARLDRAANAAEQIELVAGV